MEDRVLKVLNNLNEDIILYDGNYMLDEGIIDSLEVIDIVAALEKEFNISIGAKYIVKENFTNKESITNFMIKLLNQEKNKNDKDN